MKNCAAGWFLSHCRFLGAVGPSWTPRRPCRAVRASSLVVRRRARWLSLNQARAARYGQLCAPRRQILQMATSPVGPKRCESVARALGNALQQCLEHSAVAARRSRVQKWLSVASVGPRQKISWLVSYSASAGFLNSARRHHTTPMHPSSSDRSQSGKSCGSSSQRAQRHWRWTAAGEQALSPERTGRRRRRKLCNRSDESWTKGSRKTLPRLPTTAQVG